MVFTNHDKQKREDRKHFFLLTWPIFFEQTSVVFTNIADSLMLSWVSDAAAGAGGTVINTIMYLSYVIVWLTCAGAGTILSQSIGAKLERQKLQQIMVSGIAVLVAVGLLVGMTVGVFSSFFSALTGLQGEQLQLGAEYLAIAGPGLLPFALMMILSEFLRQHGKTKIVMVAMIIMNISNILGNYLLTTGLWFFPQMGIDGIAIATVISRCVGFTILLPTFVLLFIGKDNVSISIKGILQSVARFWWDFIRVAKQLNIIIKEAIRIIKVSLPSTLESAMHPLVMFAAILVVSHFGPEALTTRTYVFSLSLLPLCFTQSLSITTRILVARKVGAKDYDGANDVKSFGLLMTMVMSVGVSLLVWLNSDSILSLFTDNPQILVDGKICLGIAVLMEIGRTAANISGNALRASGDYTAPAVISIVCLPLIVIPSVWFFCSYLNLGVIGFFIALAIDEIVRGGIFLERWYNKRWFAHKDKILNMA